jgi:hypothetical protein
MELDKVATVSFRGYEVIRKIEFYGEESKYKKGLFYNRMELSRLSRLLEQYGESILPLPLMQLSLISMLRLSSFFKSMACGIR